MNAPGSASADRGSRRALVWLLALTALVYIGTAPLSDLFDENDSQYVGAAREMLHTGHWLVPTNNGLPRLQKPPLVYWLTAPSLALFGENEFAARLPTALIVCLLTAFTYLIGERLGGPRRGFMAGLALAMSFGIFIFGKMVMPEPYLTCFVTGTLYCVLSGYQDAANRCRWYLAAWTCAALAALSKGLHGAIYPALIVVVLVIGSKHSQATLRPLLSWRGVLVFLAILAPWYVAMEMSFPGFLPFHFINEQAGHALGTHYPNDDTPVPAVPFVLQHAIWFFPWTLFVPAAWIVWRRNWHNDELAERLPVVWFGVVIVSTMLSRRQDYYAMCAWPAFALWVSRLWTAPQLHERNVRRWVVGGFVVLLLISIGGLAAAALEHHWLSGGGTPSAIPTANRDNFLNAIHGFSLNSWRRLLPLMWGAFGVLTAGALAAIVLAWFRRGAAAAIVAAVAMLGPLGAAAGGLKVMAPYFSLAKPARYINRHAAPADQVVFEGEPHVASSLFFYLNRPVHWLGVPSQIEFACRAHHIGEDKFLSESALPALWQGPVRIFLILEETRAAYWSEKLGLPPGSLKPLVTSGTRWLVSNR